MSISLTLKRRDRRSPSQGWIISGFGMLQRSIRFKKGLLSCLAPREAHHLFSFCFYLPATWTRIALPTNEIIIIWGVCSDEESILSHLLPLPMTTCPHCASSKWKSQNVFVMYRLDVLMSFLSSTDGEWLLIGFQGNGKVASEQPPDDCPFNWTRGLFPSVAW